MLNFAKPFLTLFLSFAMLPTLACLNEYTQRNLSGDSSEYMHEGLPHFTRWFDSEESEKFLAKHDLANVQMNDYQTRSDVAFHLCRLGHYEEGLVIFKDLYKRFPSEYNIMSNLGTAYELVGKPDSAYYILKRTNELHPEGHYGTEWVHLKVLEAKLEVLKNKDWLIDHRVINMGIRPASNPDSAQSFDTEDLIGNVVYQLEERIPFTPTPDLLLANILNETAGATAVEHSISEAYILYYIALQYDPVDHYGVKEKMTRLKEFFTKYKVVLPDSATLHAHFPPMKSRTVAKNRFGVAIGYMCFCSIVIMGAGFVYVKKRLAQKKV